MYICTFFPSLSNPWQREISKKISCSCGTQGLANLCFTCSGTQSMCHSLSHQLFSDILSAALVMIQLVWMKESACEFFFFQETCHIFLMYDILCPAYRKKYDKLEVFGIIRMSVFSECNVACKTEMVVHFWDSQLDSFLVAC